MKKRSSPDRNPNGKHCRVVGLPLHTDIEDSIDPEKIDHVWITLEVAGIGIVRASLNTFSRQSKRLGFDHRLRIGIWRSPYKRLPKHGLFDSTGLRYESIERKANIFYEHYEPRDVELLLLEKVNEAALVEIWGEFYDNRHLGIHQIHSRRTSCAITQDIHGRDGALKCYYENRKESELFLFKFCGQP